MKRWGPLQLTTQKHSHLTNCFNVSLMVHEKDLFWYITNYIINEILKWALQTAHLSLKWAATSFFHFWTHFINSPRKPSILIYHNPYHKWNSEMSSPNDSLEPKVSRYNFFHFWPLFINSPWKRSFLIYHNHIQNEISKWAPQNDSIELNWAENKPVIFFPLFDPILFIVQSNYQFWCATLRTLYEIFKWAPQNDSIELNWAENKPVIFFSHFDPILFIVQTNYQFWSATLWTLNEIFKWAPKSAQLSAIKKPLNLNFENPKSNSS